MYSPLSYAVVPIVRVTYVSSRQIIDFRFEAIITLVRILDIRIKGEDVSFTCKNTFRQLLFSIFKEWLFGDYCGQELVE